MDLRELRLFVALAERGHFGATAALLGISQPALSKQIRQLEKQVGGRLFVRSRQGAELTEAGQLLLMDAQSLVRASDDWLDRARRTSLGQIGRIQIGFGFSALMVVASAVAGFRKQYPAVEISLTDMSSSRQVDALRKGTIQVGLVRLPVGKEFHQRKFLADRMALVVPENWEYGRPQSLADCRDLPFVSLSHDMASGFYGHVMRLCEEAGFLPRVVQETTEFHTVMACVAAGIGVGVVSESFLASRQAHEGVRVQPLHTPTAAWDIGAVWRKDNSSPLVNQFVRLLQQSVRATGKFGPASA